MTQTASQDNAYGPNDPGPVPEDHPPLFDAAESHSAPIVEWGYRYPGGAIAFPVTEERARHVALNDSAATLIRRTVTPWTEVDQ